MISLSDLTARAKAATAAKEAEKAAAKASRTRPATEEELELRAQADWRPIALVAVYDHWKCACGAEGQAPAGIMTHSEHTRMANSFRLAAPRFESEVPQNLPRKWMERERIVAICPICAGDLGFNKELDSKHTPHAAPVLGDFSGEGAGFVQEWRRLRGELPTLELPEPDTKFGGDGPMPPILGEAL